jgi:hypothetical protein
MLMRLKSLALLAAGAALLAGEAAAAPEVVGSFGRWTTLTAGAGSERVCYVAGVPLSAEGNYTRRDDTFFFITRRPGEGVVDEVSVLAGYPYKPDAETVVTIDGRRFGLATDGDTAWAYTAAQDRRMVEAIRAGRKMVVKGTSSRGTLTTDTYDLQGTAAAHQAMSRACS